MVKQPDSLRVSYRLDGRCCTVGMALTNLFLQSSGTGGESDPRARVTRDPADRIRGLTSISICMRISIWSLECISFPVVSPRDEREVLSDARPAANYFQVVGAASSSISRLTSPLIDCMAAGYAVVRLAKHLETGNLVRGYALLMGMRGWWCAKKRVSISSVSVLTQVAIKIMRLPSISSAKSGTQVPPRCLFHTRSLVSSDGV